MIELEVRCCCDAHLIGWLKVPGRPYVGKVLVFLLEPRAGTRASDESFETLSFQADIVERPSGGTYVALKSRDYPLAELRRINEFVEATALQTAAAQ